MHPINVSELSAKALGKSSQILTNVRTCRIFKKGFGVNALGSTKSKMNIARVAYGLRYWLRHVRTSFIN